MPKTRSVFDILTQSGERLPAISRWLLDDVWSQKRWEQASPVEYLERGEREVHRAEELILTSAASVYDEIVAVSLRSSKWDLLEDEHVAVVVLDGASIRELPILKKLAEDTGFDIVECDTRSASLPSETLYFVEQRLLGKRVAPSDLPKRQEFKEKGVCAVYYDAPIRFDDTLSGPWLVSFVVTISRWDVQGHGIKIRVALRRNAAAVRYNLEEHSARNSTRVSYRYYKRSRIHLLWYRDGVESLARCISPVRSGSVQVLW